MSKADEVTSDPAIVRLGRVWAEAYMDIVKQLGEDGKIGRALGPDTTKEVAALILVQLMERYA